MHCPQCGRGQVSGETRFCRACGFALEDVRVLLVPDKKSERPNELRKNAAFNQGLGLMLVSLVLVIVLTLLRDFDLVPQSVVKLVGAIFVLAGLVRMFYPYVVADNRREIGDHADFVDAAAATTKLPDSLPPQSTSFAEWENRRVDTDELVDVPSVTEHTTRKLSEPGENN
jgi:hypothetical protein